MERKNEKAEKERGGNVKFCSNDRELEGRKREEFFSVQNKLCILKGYHGICSLQFLPSFIQVRRAFGLAHAVIN